MLEPLLMLTVLNCVFMFSSTMTTCALWWQYKRNRDNCPTHGDPKQNVKKSKSCKNKTFSKQKAGNTGSKSGRGKRDKSNPKCLEDDKKEKKDKLLGVLMERSSHGILMKANEEGFKTLEKLTSTEDIQLVAPLPSSDAKSTIVMEFSTMQKLMQVRDSKKSRKPKGKLTYTISPETARKVQLIVEDDSAHKISCMKKG